MNENFVDPTIKRYPITKQPGEAPGSTEYTVYILDEVGAPYEFVEVISALEEAEEQDLVVFKLATPGGRLDSTVLILDGIENTKAYTVAEVLGNVASAGTLIATACDGMYVSKHVEFMCHYYSGGIGGKGHEIKASAEFTFENTPKLFHDAYSKFMTKKEINRLIDGKDYYFNTEQVQERWDRVIAYRTKQAEKAQAEAAIANDLQVIEYLKEKGYSIKKPK